MRQSASIPYIVAVAAVILVLAGSFLADLSDDQVEGIEATLVCPGEFTSIQLDVPRDVFFQHGVELGDCLILDFPGQQLKGYFIQNHSGIASFDVFVNCYEDDQIVELGIYDYDIFKVLTDSDYGTKFKITRSGEKSSYYDKIPHYMAGYSDDVNDFDSLEAYGNYRKVDQGNFQDGRLYRSASPMQPNGTRNIYCASISEMSALTMCSR